MPLNDKKGRPRRPCRTVLLSSAALSPGAVDRSGSPGRCLVAAFDHAGFAAADFDSARLHPLGQLTLELDVQQAVFQIGTGHLDVIGQLEAAFEAAIGNTAVQEGTLVAVFLFGL